MKRIVICMGSSCFARGNARNVELAEAFLDAHPEIEARVDLRGGLCCDRCADGPNVVVDGVVHARVDEPAMQALLGALLS
ncbi:MAG: (2Fe-2S) ferredoxin domain-containing protein [Kiritimatiellae bacterium]|nr:(2Fe-2S) ferredoxin domain-containing protein [Kiritimatiellia bacterium]